MSVCRSVWLSATQTSILPSYFIPITSHFHSVFHSFIHSFIYSFIYSFIRSFITSFIYSYIHSFCFFPHRHSGHLFGIWARIVSSCDTGGAVSQSLIHWSFIHHSFNSFIHDSNHSHRFSSDCGHLVGIWVRIVPCCYTWGAVSWSQHFLIPLLYRKLTKSTIKANHVTTIASEISPFIHYTFFIRDNFFELSLGVLKS